jgi:hypothetical protein
MRSASMRGPSSSSTTSSAATTAAAASAASTAAAAAVCLRLEAVHLVSVAALAALASALRLPEGIAGEQHRAALSVLIARGSSVAEVWRVTQPLLLCVEPVPGLHGVVEACSKFDHVSPA